MNINWFQSLLGGMLLVALTAPLWGQTFYSQVGNEQTAPASTATTPLYRSSSTST